MFINIRTHEDKVIGRGTGCSGKILFFHCSPSLAYIDVRDLQSPQRKTSVQSLLLAGNFLYNQWQPSAASQLNSELMCNIWMLLLFLFLSSPPPPFTLWNSKWWPRKWKVASRQDERKRRFPILRVIRYATIATVPVGRWILLLLSYSSKICKLFQEVENIHVLMNFVSQCLKISKKISLIWIFFGIWYWFLEWKFKCCLKTLNRVKKLGFLKSF